MDFSKLTQMADQLRDTLKNSEEQAAKLVETGDAGAGLVQADVNGKHELLRLRINPKLLQGDVNFLSDLICAAVNQANQRAVARLQDSLKNLSQNFGVDLSQFTDKK